MTTTTPIVLSDLIAIPRIESHPRVRSAVLVLAGALFTALSAQVVIHLGFTPVPLTGQTFAVLTVGSLLGFRRAVASQAVYWAMGAIGLPFYQSGNSGWDYATGSTFGYFIGFVLAAGIVGWFADNKNDRNYVMSLSSLFMASGIIYISGALWLSFHLGIPVATGDKNAISLGVAPFLAGDVVKVLLAAAVAPMSWALHGTKFR